MPLTRAAAKALVDTTHNVPKALTKSKSRGKDKGKEFQPKIEDEPVQLSSPPATPPPTRPARKKAASIDSSATKIAPEIVTSSATLPTPISTRKRKRATPLKAEKSEADDEIDLPHGLGRIKRNATANAVKPDLASEPKVEPSNAKTSDVHPAKASGVSPAKKPRSSTASNKQRGLDLQQLAQKIGIPGHDEPRLDYMKYGHIPGTTPFPELAHPTHAEAQEVYDRLAALHGHVNQSDLLPPPSLERAGCGDVRSVLDALVRTYLSSNTSDRNSSAALQGMITRYGLATEGSMADSVNYTAVYAAPQTDLEKAIQGGGMAPKKSKSIMTLLDAVNSENQLWLKRKAEDSSLHLQNGGGLTGSASDVEASVASVQKDLETNPLSLQYVTLLPTQSAILHMVKYPGIGLKTAACVALYCLRRQVFPVDTHVQRICQGLGWTVVGCNENKTFSHNEHMLPDHLKYGLHDLFVRHGKECGKCKAGATEKSARWEEGCPLDGLIVRERMKSEKVKAKESKVEDEVEAE